MDKYSLTIEKEISIMQEFGMSAEEWFFVRLLFLASEPESKPEFLATYFTECKKSKLPLETLLLLKEKKILSSKYKVPAKGEVFDVRKVEFSKTFLARYMRCSFELGEELFESFPSYLQLNGGKLVSAKNITKAGFQSLEDFFFAYGKAIKHSVETHQKVLESLEYAKKADLIHYGIAEYVITRKWNDHRAMMEGRVEDTKVVLKYDTLEVV